MFLSFYNLCIHAKAVNHILQLHSLLILLTDYFKVIGFVWITNRSSCQKSTSYKGPFTARLLKQNAIDFARHTWHVFFIIPHLHSFIHAFFIFFQTTDRKKFVQQYSHFFFQKFVIRLPCKQSRKFRQLAVSALSHMKEKFFLYFT